ncbi:MAG: alpha/beta fold hydrolase [Pseudomonadota bacterium]
MTALTVLILLLMVLAIIWRWVPTWPARLFIWLDRTAGRVRSCEIDVNDQRWHMLEGGHGEPLVLIHGFNADADNFNRVARHLVGHFRVLAPDLPGFGDTELIEGLDFRIDQQADRVVAWMDRIGIKRCYLGGSSMGGYIACAIARKHPDRVRALWLLAPGGVHGADHSPLFQEIEEDRHNPLVVRDLNDMRRLIDFCFVHPPYLPAPLLRHMARRSAARTTLHQRVFDAMRFDSTPLEDMVDGLSTPALIVWGRSDQVLHASGAAIVQRLMSNAETLMLPDTGHLPMLENPRTVAECWISYSERLARTRESST